MFINYHLLTIFWVRPNSKFKQQNNPSSHHNRPKWLMLQASSYLSIGHLVLHLMCWSDTSDDNFKHEERPFKISKHKKCSSMDLLRHDICVTNLKGLVHKYGPTYVRVLGDTMFMLITVTSCFLAIFLLHLASPKGVFAIELHDVH